MPLVRGHADADYQVEEHNQDNREESGRDDADLPACLERELERARRRAAAHAGHAPEALLGFHNLSAFHVDMGGAMVGAGMAVNALLFVAPDLEGAEAREKAQERAVGTE